MPEGGAAASPSPSSDATPAAIPNHGDSPDDSRLAQFPNQFHGPRRYDILGEHGRGGLGKVSRAFDRKLGRDVAIKELHSRGAFAEVRFLREVLITARLEHPSIVPIHEAGRWPDGTPYYAMKLVSGRSLRDLIADRPTFEQRIGLLHHVIAVADAIAYAHGRNIIHRDLKPANVIVGDFGETIVIDWGLAKDLSASDPVPDSSDDFVASHGTDVTVEGSVVGTPAYMAPEQKRGEAADQRADVFAIGTMLWELCAVQKVPPRAHLRTRMLRRAGVDADFAAIINKALEPDRDRRYPDAGALAADLKAFKSGARIAARDYSFFAMLVHWTRRHRTLALAAAVAVLLAAAGSLVYVRNIAIERDRADRSLDALTLKHAELLLLTDPSAAVDALASYQGSDRIRADQIRAEAVGRGVAFLRAQPHTNNIMWTASDPNGAILALSTDGTITRTYLDGRSVVLTRGVSKIGMSSYSRVRNLLAYTCDPSDLCLFDFIRNTRTPLTSALQGANITSASFSPDGTMLAVTSEDDTLRLLDVSDPNAPVVRLVKTVSGVKGVAYIDASVLVTNVKGGVEFIATNGDSERLELADLERWDTDAATRQVAVATKDGQTVLLEPFPARIVARAQPCQGSIRNLQFIPGRQSIAYACREGKVGIWDPRQGTVHPRAQLEGHADFVRTSPTGDYVVAGGSNGIVTVIDLHTDLIASYKGHGFRLLSITPPSREQPFVISADVQGAVRAWPIPPRFARVAATANSPFRGAIFDRESTTVTATSRLPALTVFSLSSGMRTIEPHEPFNTSIERSGSGKTFVTYGPELVEVWSSATMNRTAVIATGHGSITQLRFVGDTDDFMTSGNDGRIVRWTSTGDATLIAQLKQPVDRFAVIASLAAVVFSTVDGALWRIAADGRIQSLRAPGARVNRIVAEPYSQRLYIGYTDGEVIAIDTRTWQQHRILYSSAAIHAIASTESGNTIAVASNNGIIHVSNGRGTSSSRSPTWQALQASARDIAVTDDDLLIATCTDGTIWLYSVPQRRWLCLSVGTVDLGRLALAANDKAAVALDRDGRLIWIDLDAARKLIDLAGPYRN